MVDNSRTEPDFCQFQTYPGSWFDPPEYCPNHAEPDEDFCGDHLPRDLFVDPDVEFVEDDIEEDVSFDWDRYEGDTE